MLVASLQFSVSSKLAAISCYNLRKPFLAGAGCGLQTRWAALVPSVGSTPTGFRHPVLFPPLFFLVLMALSVTVLLPVPWRNLWL